MSDIKPEIVDYINNITTQLELERNKRMTMETQLGQASLVSGGKDQNAIELQLDLEKLLDKIYHLLSGHQVKRDEENNREYWAEPDDDRLKLFNEYGVKIIMNLLSMHVNIDTLMSYHEDNEIKWKTRDFGIELSDLFTQRYETLLYYPSPEELYERYERIIKEDDFNITDQELYEKCVKWSEDELANKENYLSIIFWGLVYIVHNTYTRSYRGKERQSLGERGINISQSSQPQDLPITPQKKGGFLGMFKG